MQTRTFFLLPIHTPPLLPPPAPHRKGTLRSLSVTTFEFRSSNAPRALAPPCC